MIRTSRPTASCGLTRDVRGVLATPNMRLKRSVRAPASDLQSLWSAVRGPHPRRRTLGGNPCSLRLRPSFDAFWPSVLHGGGFSAGPPGSALDQSTSKVTQRRCRESRAQKRSDSDLRPTLAYYFSQLSAVENLTQQCLGFVFGVNASMSGAKGLGTRRRVPAPVTERI